MLSDNAASDLQPEIVQLDDLDPVACPCGWARRAFAQHTAFSGTVHLTEISRDAQRHSHREHTEIYIVLECDDAAAIELDGQLHPVRPLTAILIPPGVRHRAVGQMRVLIICQPEFDPADEQLH